MVQTEGGRTVIPQVEPCIGREEKRNIKQVLRNKWLTEGKYAEEFIERIKGKTQAEYVVLAPNGTLAIYLALLACGIKRGDWVIVPDFTFNATASPLSFIGAVPQFVDVDADSLNISPTEVEEAVDKKTKAIIPVHIFGQPANMDSIMSIAENHKLKVIEDAAQGIGSLYYSSKGLRHQHVGTIGDIGILSFFADKTITTGEGACLLTNDENIYKKLLLLRNQGRYNSGKFIHDEIGMNFRMTDLQCAIGVAQIKKLRWITKRKNEIYSQYMDRLYPHDSLDFIKTRMSDAVVPFRFPLRVKNGKRLQVMQSLEKAGVQTRGFFYPLHRQPCWKNLLYDDICFENTNQAYAEGVCLPIYPSLREYQVDYICDTVLEAIA